MTTTSNWVLLGAPWDCSGTGRGEESAPQALRCAGLATLIRHDAGDVDAAIANPWRDPETGVLALGETVRAATQLAGTLTDVLTARPHDRPLVVGGDCSILLGIVPALRRAIGPVGLWFVDGHPDYVDGPGSETGETADMDLAILTGDGAEPLVTLDGPPPMIDVTDVVLLGHRTEGLGAESVAELARVPKDLRRIDAGTVMADPSAAGEQAARWLANSGNGVWLHIDLDVLDETSLPAVTYPQSHGPDWSQLYEALLPLARSPRLLGMSVADFRPDLDPTGELAAAIVRMLEAVLR
ncbi:arginase family protein [Virgisporangium aurantiacum]|uniref:Arginase n=1 Tax=Virgisporangium aurantiacum TaxID=175570 RepID=A0A8J3ZE17_9ACTN|nr:arginase family protein [Virgisporangium aurantiacum]GIJ62297.1 arginase [Virgisporangium aurantiacum]